MFGRPMGRVEDHRVVPTREEIGAYWHTHVRIPQSELEWTWQYEKAGFRFITVDYTLSKVLPPEKTPVPVPDSVRRLARKAPDFEIRGFFLSGSRLVIDPVLRRRLKREFWDDMIRNHCSSFADFVLCSVDERRRLNGFVSCFEHSDALELFLVVVHPDCRGKGTGGRLMQSAEAVAQRSGKHKLLTNVISGNFEAMNFYIKYGFGFETGHIIMHHSTESPLPQ